MPDSLVNPNNPTGNVADSEKLTNSLASLRNGNCMIVADEIYDGLDFTGEHAVASRSDGVPVFSLNGVSKVYYAPGWRIGYMAIHDPIGSMPDVRDGKEIAGQDCASTPANGYIAGLEGDRTGWRTL